MKKLFAIFCVVCVLLSLSGCGLADSNVETLLSPPTPSGELYDVWQVINSLTPDTITLKYPSSGEYRSAIITKDLNSDNIPEAVAFYSTTLDNVTTMHISLIAKEKDKWSSFGDISLVATGIEKVEFADINGDGVLEIVVGWNVYGSVQKSVGVYSLSSMGIVTRILENHTSYICRDFDFDSNPDLLVINKDTIKEISTAKLLDLIEDGAKEIGSCALDASVTEYFEPIVFSLDNKTAVYIDGIKGKGMVTEMLIIENNIITNLSFSGGTNTAFDTYRAATSPTLDIIGDGNYDIPIPYLLTQSALQSENVYKTNWYSYDGNGIGLTASTIMNYNDGYFIEIPEKWDASIAASVNTADKTLTIFRLDNATGASAEMLLKISAVSKNGNLVSSLEGSFVITETADTTFYATFGDYSGLEAINETELGSLFKTISKKQ